MQQIALEVRGMIRDIPDFPKPGILFKDITTALKDAETLKKMVDFICENFKTDNNSFNKSTSTSTSIQSAKIFLSLAFKAEVASGSIDQQPAPQTDPEISSTTPSPTTLIEGPSPVVSTSSSGSNQADPGQTGKKTSGALRG